MINEKIGIMGFRRKGGGISSFLIRLICKSPYSHCFWVDSPTTLIESNGFQVADRWGFEKNSKRIEECDYYVLKDEFIKDFDYDKALNYAKSCYGQKYEYSLLLKLYIAKRFCFGIFEKFIRRFIKDIDQKMICSEYLDKIFLAGKVDLIGHMVTSVITPDELSKSDKLRKVTEEEKKEFFKKILE